MNQHKICILGAASATLILAILSSPFHFPHMADDFVFLSAARGSDFGFHTFGHFVSRFPVWVMITYLTFKNFIWENTSILIYVFFAIYAWSICRLVLWFTEQMDLPQERLTGPLLLVLLVTIFYPNHYEILFSSQGVGYSVGVIFLALSVAFSSRFLQVIFYILAFLTSETFILPALFLPLTPSLVSWLNGKRPIRRTEIFQGFYVWVAALALVLVIRLSLAQEFGLTKYAIDLNLDHIFYQALSSFKMLWQIHFFKTNWVATVLIWILGIGVAFHLMKTNQIRAKVFLGLFAIAFCVVGQNLILAYFAPRAYFGGAVLLSVLLSYFYLLFLRSQNLIKLPQVRGYWVVLLILIVQLEHLMTIFIIKDHNYHVLQNREADLNNVLHDCDHSCSIEVSHLDFGIKRDFVLPDYAWPVYLNWLALKNAPEKSISFVVDYTKDENAPAHFKIQSR